MSRCAAGSSDVINSLRAINGRPVSHCGPKVPVAGHAPVGAPHAVGICQDFGMEYVVVGLIVLGVLILGGIIQLFLVGYAAVSAESASRLAAREYSKGADAGAAESAARQAVGSLFDPIAEVGPGNLSEGSDEPSVSYQGGLEEPVSAKVSAIASHSSGERTWRRRMSSLLSSRRRWLASYL